MTSGLVELTVTIEDAVFGGGQSTCSVIVEVDNGPAAENSPTCSINAPAGGAAVGGVTTIDFDATSPSSNQLTTTLEVSTNAGLTWSHATDAGTGGLVGNPTAPFVPGAGLTWDWDSDQDIPGAAPSTVLRATVTDTVSGLTGACTTVVDVDNAPTCTVTAPAAGSSVVNFVLVSFTGTSPANNTLLYDLAYSTNSGASFEGATDWGGGSVFGNPTFIPAPSGPQTWEWDTSADIRTDEESVIFQVTAIDSVTGESNVCSVVWDVPNQATCEITSPAAFSTVSGNTLISFTTAQPSPNGLDLSFTINGTPATDAGGGSAIGNPVLGDAPGADSWEWATALDVPNGLVELELTITDAVFGGGESSCSVILDVDNGPL